MVLSVEHKPRFDKGCLRLFRVAMGEDRLRVFFLPNTLVMYLEEPSRSEQCAEGTRLPHI